jgi:Xaa-Pro aminopeptidase
MDREQEVAAKLERARVWLERHRWDGLLLASQSNFAWATGYAFGAPLGGALADLRGDLLSYLFLTVVCLLTLPLLRKTI